MFVETPTNIKALMMVSEESRNRSVQWPIRVGKLFYSKGLRSGAGGRSAPHKHSFGVNAGAQLDAAHAHH